MKKLTLLPAMIVCSAIMFTGCRTSNKVQSAPGLTAEEWSLAPFKRIEKANPVISPLTTTTFYCPMSGEEIKWEESDTFNPAAVTKDNKIVVLYRAEDNSATGIGKRTSRIGYAESSDGYSMKRLGSPVLYPSDDDHRQLEWRGGCEDPRVVETEDGTYVMLYTGWNRENPAGTKKTPRLCVATSRDLKHWTKHGLAFDKAENGRYRAMECKSASVVTAVKDGRLIAVKINGKYMMYWGEKAVCAATSVDMINWEPVTDATGEMMKLVTPRAGFFDSKLTECGPPAIMTPKGIVLIYNGKNAIDGTGDANYPTGTYAAGQLLFSSTDPLKLLGRLDKPFFAPEADFEKSGQYPDGTVFTEGLAYLNNKLYMYYGCADSYVAVAVLDNPKILK